MCTDHVEKRGTEHPSLLVLVIRSRPLAAVVSSFLSRWWRRPIRRRRRRRRRRWSRIWRIRVLILLALVRVRDLIGERLRVYGRGEASKRRESNRGPAISDGRGTKDQSFRCRTMHWASVSDREKTSELNRKGLSLVLGLCCLEVEEDPNCFPSPPRSLVYLHPRVLCSSRVDTFSKLLFFFFFHDLLALMRY